MMGPGLHDFLVAFGLMAVMEGVLYAAAPSALRKAIRQMLDLPDTTLRIGGLVVMAAGVALVWAIRG